MGVLFDYLVADSDEQAASVIDWVGGPKASVTSAHASPRHGLFRRKVAAEPPQAVSAFDAVSVGGVDPVVQLGTLEELLTGTPYDDIVNNVRSGHTIAERNGGERLVLTLTDELQTALAAASEERLTEVAIPWSKTEEFFGTATPEDLATVLRELAGLARRAEVSNQRLYCWVCV